MKRATDPDVILLQAAADPTRLAILRQLSVEGTVCACNFTSCCDVAQPTVSHHLKVLREAGWIAGERRGTWIWYAILPEALARFREIAREMASLDARPVGAGSGVLGVVGVGSRPVGAGSGPKRLPVIQPPA